MSDEFERILRDSLQHRGETPEPIDLAAGALRRAGNIRRRRRLVTGASVVAVAALALPVGLHVVERDPDHTASKPVDDALRTRPVEVAIAGLSQGDAPAVPYLDDGVFRADGQEVALKVKTDVTDAVGTDGGALVWTRDGSGTAEISEARSGSVVATRATSPVVNPSTPAAAWAFDPGAGAPHDGDRVVVMKTDDGQTQTTGLAEQQVVQVMGVSGDSVVYNARQGKSRSVNEVDVATGVEAPAWLGATYVTAIDSSLRRMAVHTEGSAAGCITVVDREQSSEWQTCEWRPVEFSTDGTVMLALRADSDGLGQRELGVLDAEDGDVRQVLTTEGTFGRATFEGNESVVAVLADGDQAAIVRCGIESGECELATEPATVVPDDPDSLVAPYQLTAN